MRVRVGVATVPEAFIVRRAGIRAVEVGDPADGAGGTAPLRLLRRVAVLSPDEPVGAFLGAAPLAPRVAAGAATAAVDAGATVLRVSVAGQPDARAVAALLDAVATDGVAVVATWATDAPALGLPIAPLAAVLEAAAACGASGVTLGTLQPGGRPLRARRDDLELATFVERAHDVGVRALAHGGLRLEDLVVLDALGFDEALLRGAICVGSHRQARIDVPRLRDLAAVAAPRATEAA